MQDRAAAFAETLGITDPAVRRAFAGTPRHLFLPGLSPDEVYRDDALPTRWVGNRPTSSSTQPSLMANMLEGLRLRPGMRVLEIGAGTGYNAALIRALTGAPVVSIDVQAEVVAEARDALRRAAVSGVLVEHADGYPAYPAGRPFDRLIVTCGIRGIPPGWLAQLAPDGFVLAPLAHGGLHPIVAAGSDRRLTVHSGRAGFMHAAGPLYPVLPDDHPPPMVPEPEPDVARPMKRLTGRNNDFWFAAAAMDRRVTRTGGAPGWLPALVDGPTVAWFGTVALHAAGPDAARLADEAEALLSRWESLGSPPATAWSATLEPAQVIPPLLTARSWRV